jgi:hypothetical protein
MSTSKKTLGVALAAAFAATGMASAADSGFAMKPMAQGYMIAEAATTPAASDAKPATTTPPAKKTVKKTKAKTKATTDAKAKSAEGKCGGKQEKAAEAACGGKTGSKIPTGKCAPGACGGNMGK